MKWLYTIGELKLFILRSDIRIKVNEVSRDSPEVINTRRKLNSNRELQSGSVVRPVV